MATISTSAKVAAGVQPKASRISELTTVSTFSANGSLSTGDVIQMVKVPVNGTVIDIKVSCVLSGQGSIKVGDGVSTARYISDTGASASSGILSLNAQGFVPYTYSTDDTIDVIYSGSTNASSGALYMIATIAIDT